MLIPPQVLPKRGQAVVWADNVRRIVAIGEFSQGERREFRAMLREGRTSPAKGWRDEFSIRIQCDGDAIEKFYVDYEPMTPIKKRILPEGIGQYDIHLV